MKTCITTTLALLLIVSGFAQPSKFEFTGRYSPSVKKEMLSNVEFVNDISPELWAKMYIPHPDRALLDLRRIMVLPQPENYAYPQENYKQIVDIVSVEISAVSNGKTLTAQSSSDKLTVEQKNILSSADLGSNISVKIKFQYKDQRADNYGSRAGILEGNSVVTIVPDTEAEFPGGHKEITAYYTKHVIDRIASPSSPDNVLNAILRFTVNEQGQIVDAKIERTSKDPYIDRLLLDVTAKMPKWKPAENANGVKVKQEFVIPFGGGGGC